jgi:hypothetical protein
MGVNFFGFDSIPMFTGSPDTGGPTGAPASQIKLFDVYYIHEPIVGVQVIGASDECDVIGFHAVQEPDYEC